MYVKHAILIVRVSSLTITDLVSIEFIYEKIKHVTLATVSFNKVVKDEKAI